MLLLDKVVLLSDKIVLLSDKIVSLSDKIVLLLDKIVLLSDNVVLLSDKVMLWSDKFCYYQIMFLTSTAKMGRSHGWAKRKQKCADLLRKYLMWCSITQGLFVFSHKCVLRVSQGESIRKWIFKMFQTISCGYSKLVSQGAWYNAKGINLIRASSDEKTPKMFLNIGIISSTDKWAISDHFFDVFWGQDDRIELNPFALYQAS